MSLQYILEHIEISMVITALIGMLGMIYEPGPVPSLMALIGATYLIAYWICMAFFSFAKYEKKTLERKAKATKAPRKKETARCYFYDLKTGKEQAFYGRN